MLEFLGLRIAVWDYGLFEKFGVLGSTVLRESFGLKGMASWGVLKRIEVLGLLGFGDGRACFG